MEQAFAAHGHATPENKRVAILISILAGAMLALASASIMTGVTALVFVAIGVSAVGAGLGLLGWLAPTLLHL